jgi:hypothetical protein
LARDFARQEISNLCVTWYCGDPARVGQIYVLTVFPDDDRLIAAPEKSAVAAVKSVESLRVESVEMLHHPGEISLGRAQTHMIVSAHNTIGKYFHCPTIANFTDGLKKSFVVLLVEEDFLPRTSTVHYVIDGSGILNTKRPRHEMVSTTEYQ